MYTLAYVKQTASGSLMYDAGDPQPVLHDSLEEWGREGGGGGLRSEGTVPMANSCWCLAKTITILSSN